MTPEERAAAVVREVAADEHAHDSRLAFPIAKAICAAVAAEREACARLCETLPFADCQMNDGRSADLAEAIRARGKE